MHSTLSNTKNDIKNAILNQKNGYVDGGMVTYPDAIRNIKDIHYIPTLLVPNGLKFGGSNRYDFSEYDFSNVTDAAGMFAGIYLHRSKTFENVVLNDTCGNFENCNAFLANTKCTRVELDFPKCKYAVGMFGGCSNLTTVALGDMPSVTDIEDMFYGCSNLTTVILGDMPSVTDAAGMFSGCSNLTSVTFGERDTNDIFLPLCERIGNMFINCTQIRNMRIISNNLKDIGAPFFNCTNLRSAVIGYIDDCTGLYNIFGSRPTEFVEDSWCKQLLSCEILGDGSTITLVTADLITESVQEFNGIQNLGGSPYWQNNGCGIAHAKNLSYNSLLNIINKLYDRATAGYSIARISLHPDSFAKLSDEDIAIATNKGWTVAITSSYI